jgi:hypothetical protein
MSAWQNVKLLFRGGTLLALTACLWFFSAGRSAPPQSAQAQQQIVVKTEQLPPDNGVVPVQIKCDNVTLLAPNAADTFTCTLKNNTHKFINAATLVFSYTIEQGGRESFDSSFTTVDSAVHPDIRAARTQSFGAPAGELPVQELRTSYEEAVIKGVHVAIDYIEFTDNSTLGPNHAGAQTIAGMRAGAAKYKAWLVRVFKQSGGLVGPVVAQCESQPMPEQQIGLKGDDEQQGAIIYRNFTLRTYRTKGAEAVEKALKAEPLTRQAGGLLELHVQRLRAVAVQLRAAQLPDQLLLGRRGLSLPPRQRAD